MKPDTILGGKITTLKEVFDGKTTTFVYNRIQIGSSPTGYSAGILDSPGKPLPGELAGLWRYRVQEYRMICNIEDSKLVVRVSHRKDVFE